jgi:hypothetical protein
MTTLAANLFACFPLTLTLSLREREQFSIDLQNSNEARFACRLATILPLPGERAGVRASVI